ncbi:hypothetical protein [Citrobacter freundii]|uniref:Uncharacterized protein n=1 Tax=Citrobacter freundii TaxID=546 RepID=A0A7G2IRX5_CITFR|nr:hypothetical protein [Citrobacter freundii]
MVLNEKIVNKLQRDKMVYMKCIFVFYCFDWFYFEVNELGVNPLCK